jgi:FdrA protein
MNKINELFSKELKVINMGLESFHKDLKSQDVDSIQMNWRPTAGGNEKMMALLARLKTQK